MKRRDEVKWILLCLQGQRNNGSSHGSRGRCPCVTVCTSMSQVCCDLQREEKESEDRVKTGEERGITGMRKEEKGAGKRRERRGGKSQSQRQDPGQNR